MTLVLLADRKRPDRPTRGPSRQRGGTQGGTAEGEGPDGKAPSKDGPDERVERARRLLEDATRKESAHRKEGQKAFTGQKVDKYFGEKLPPVCARLGCYVTDDGKRFYCVNSSCQKHKKRETKHTRRGRPEKSRFVYFRCPRCSSRQVDMQLWSNDYRCQNCKYIWQR